MKGRPPGTPKSDDPAKKKRKRNARERDLCDVKIKITEYFAGADDAAALDCEVAAALAAAAAGAGFGVLPAPGERFWTIQRVNGNGGNGKGDGVAGPHKHTLAKSDEIKKNSVQRHVAKQGKGVKKTQVCQPLCLFALKRGKRKRHLISCSYSLTGLLFGAINCMELTMVLLFSTGCQPYEGYWSCPADG